jgi:hypothetical protein
LGGKISRETVDRFEKVPIPLVDEAGPTMKDVAEFLAYAIKLEEDARV